MGVDGECRKQERPVDTSHVSVETSVRSEDYLAWFSIVKGKMEQHRHKDTNHRQCFTTRGIRLSRRARWLVYLATLAVGARMRVSGMRPTDGLEPLLNRTRMKR